MVESDLNTWDLLPKKFVLLRGRFPNFDNLTARMWRYGCEDLLLRLEWHLPCSRTHMIRFANIAARIYKDLVASSPGNPQWLGYLATSVSSGCPLQRMRIQ